MAHACTTTMLAALPAAEPSAVPLAPGQWSVSRARTWYTGWPLPLGCNFLPSTAVNDVEMWQAATFDPETIDRELGWAERIGLNSLRVFLNYVVWKTGPDEFRAHFEHVLALADDHGMSVMPILFDDCAFAGRDPVLGPQPAPVPGVHNSQWVPSPGLKVVSDQTAWPALEAYVKNMVATWASDPRILCWDLYNEPGNSNMDEASLPLAEAAFGWAREVAPEQPLTVGAWTGALEDPMSQRLMALSDVASFHGYDPPDGIRAKIARCRTFGRPVLCTEWLHRQSGNTPEAILPVFAEHRVGCWNWGLVAGRTQTYMPWGSRAGDPEPLVWQHDLLRSDGVAYSPGELALLARHARNGEL